jgi:hypothetical protein
MVDEGNVPALLAWMRSQPADLLPPSIMDDLAKAIRKLARDDLSALIETAFGEILALAVVLLLRCQRHIEARLAESDRHGADGSHIPHDLDKDGWISRAEKISRFILEVASARARVQHVGRLNDDASREARKPPGPPMGLDRAQAAPSQRSSGNGRLCGQKGRIAFT